MSLRTSRLGGPVVLLLVLVGVLIAGEGENGGSGERDARDGGERRAEGRSGPGGGKPDGKAKGRGGGSGPRGTPAQVLRVIDGDTIEVEIAGAVEDVRYIGVDTPETVKPGTPVECFGEQASAFNRRLVEGEPVRLRFDAERRDVYGRLLAYVYVAERFVNAELIEGGYARTLEIAPNDSQAPLFDRLQSEAAGAGRGLWGSC